MALVNLSSEINIIKNNQLGEDVRDAICEALKKVDASLPSHPTGYSASELVEDTK